MGQRPTARIKPKSSTTMVSTTFSPSQQHSYSGPYPWKSYKDSVTPSKGLTDNNGVKYDYSGKISCQTYLRLVDLYRELAGGVSRLKDKENGGYGGACLFVCCESFEFFLMLLSFVRCLLKFPLSH